jgi:hypothetical protein
VVGGGQPGRLAMMRRYLKQFSAKRASADGTKTRREMSFRGRSLALPSGMLNGRGAVGPVRVRGWVRRGRRNRRHRPRKSS